MSAAVPRDGSPQQDRAALSGYCGKPRGAGDATAPWVSVTLKPTVFVPEIEVKSAGAAWVQAAGSVSVRASAAQQGEAEQKTAGEPVLLHST